LGCHIYNMCFNAFMYADDMLLVSISVAELQQMIDIVKTELKWPRVCALASDLIYRLVYLC